MALELPYVHVRLGEGRPKVASHTRPIPLEPGDLATLLALDTSTPARQPPGDRVLPLERGAWAVGRGGFGGVTWRVLDAEQAPTVAHPAWLWRSSRWFDPTAPPRGPVPNPLPLRSQLDPASRLAGSSTRVAALLAALVAALRTERTPLLVVVDPSELADPAPSGRWVLLALLTLLPPDLRSDLRLSTYEAAPSPEDWDVAIASELRPGFHIVRPGDEPELHGDLPADFIFERLLAGDAEVVEEAAGWSGDGPDPWAAAIRARRPRIDAGTPTHRRRTGASLGARTPSRLGLNTPEAWLSLSHHPEEERARILVDWIEKRGAHAPSEPVLDAMATIRPPHRAVVPWARSLLTWAERGPSRAAAARHLGELLDTESLPLEPSTRASLFTEHVRMLLSMGHFDEALAALSSQGAFRLVEAGAGRVVAEAWTRLPTSRRPIAALERLVGRILPSPDGDQSIAWLWQALLVAERDARADRLLQRVAELAVAEPHLRLDALFELLVGSPQAMRWVGHVARAAAYDRLWALIAPVTTGPEDPLWEHCVDVRSQTAAPEDRIADLVGLPAPQVARLERELRQVAGSVRVWRFPDAAVAEGAARLADLPERSTLWMWLHICAAPCGDTAEGVLPAVIEAFCSQPPPDSDQRTAGLAIAEGLGAADGWTPLHHAEFLLRLTLAPTDGTAYVEDLSAAMARGLGRRRDAGEHLAGITEELAALPPDHPTLVAFLNRLLPLALSRGVPQSYLQGVHTGRWPSPTRLTWRRIVDSLGVR